MGITGIQDKAQIYSGYWTRLKETIIINTGNSGTLCRVRLDKAFILKSKSGKGAVWSCGRF